MAYDVIETKEMKIIGISAITKNADEMSGKGKIPALWQRFFEEKILEKIPNKKSPTNMAVVYTDFESDETGIYRIIIGAEVTESEDIPNDMVLRNVPQGRYAKFTTEKGSLSFIGIEAWKKI